MGLLAVGAGASEGLDKVLERALIQQKLREQERAALAEEALRGRGLDIQARGQDMAAQLRTDTLKEQSTYHDDLMQARGDELRGKQTERLDRQFNEMPSDGSQPFDLSQQQALVKGGIIPGRMRPVGVAQQTSAAAGVPEALAAVEEPTEVPGTIANSPAPSMIKFNRAPSTADLKVEAEQKRKDTAEARAQEKLDAALAKGDTRSLDLQAADALAKGDMVTYQRLLKVKKEMGQADDRPRAAPVVGPEGLPAATMRRVDAKSKAFELLPAVKNTQKMSEAVGFANALDVNTKNPADDQALIYAYAKAMDPDSVVREGEYATVQKYAQSWAQSFGFNAARVFSNVAFLTPEARQNMKTTINAKFKAAERQYSGIRKSYTDQINQITGHQDGDSYLTDFGSAFPTGGGAAAAATGGGDAGWVDVGGGVKIRKK